ncbi:hypothetical protein EXIGLDRAFT_725067 [Exidia glandulosa HHB12029]|uniref:C3H1-type domain-containing protein n=1 Tax=Exidia glandulosa HHB12029 TaxID=1314781 RepID=A0A165E7J8_EXIGL|nr:hypothetical protein EXIGLDRAFT_725067 [Exidia glandulosa HHB12029]
MPPQNYPSWYKPEPNSMRDREAAVRKEDRAARVTERLARFEELKNKGNDAFKAADYRTAHDLYHQALKAVGETNTTRKKDALPAWLNLIQVYTKTNMPDLAEKAATAALSIDPRNVKARFRRGVARKQRMMHHSAITDFELALKVDPHLKEAQVQLAETREQWDNGIGFHTGKEKKEDEAPGIDERGLSSDEESDSEDFRHEGNGRPCKLHNQSRCTAGTSCQFSHAPDISAERDLLGRNVCKNFIIDRCPLSMEECKFSHSKAYLPSGLAKGHPKWYEVQGSVDAARDLYDHWQTARAKKSKRRGESSSGMATSGFETDSRTSSRPSARLRAYEDPMARVAQREDRLMRMASTQLDHDYTDAEFDYLCEHGVNPYIDSSAAIERALADFRRNPAMAFRRSARTADYDEDGDHDDYDDDDDEDEDEDDEDEGDEDGQGDERTPAQRRFLKAMMSELDHGYTEDEFEYLCSEGYNPYVDYPEDIERALARRANATS